MQTSSQMYGLLGGSTLSTWYHGSRLQVAQPLLAVRKRAAGTRLCNFCGTWRMQRMPGPRGLSPMSSGRRVGESGVECGV